MAETFVFGAVGYQSDNYTDLSLKMRIFMAGLKRLRKNSG
jgi:hypothetical protein